MCYANRYSDLGNLSAIEHFMQTGQDQYRFTKCGDYMTWMGAARYLDRYYFLGDNFGRSGKSSVQLARDHYYNNGSQQHPKLDHSPSYPEDEPFKCADKGE